MATFQSDAVVNGKKVEVTKAGLEVVRTVTFTAAAEMAIGSVIEMVPVPKGAVVTGIKFANSAFGTGALLDAGDGDDADRFMDGVSVVAAGSQELFADGVIGNIFYKYTEDDTIDVTLMVAVMPANGVIAMKVTYKMEDSCFADEV